MKYCTHCGEKVEESMKFCSKCGTPLRKNVSAADMPKPAKKKSKAPLFAVLFLIVALAAAAAVFFWKGFSPSEKGGAAEDSLQPAEAQETETGSESELQMTDGESVVIEEAASEAEDPLEDMYGVWGLAKIIRNEQTIFYPYISASLYIFYDGTAFYPGERLLYSSTEQQFVGKKEGSGFTIGELEVYDITDTECMEYREGGDERDVFEKCYKGAYEIFPNDGMKGLITVDTEPYEGQVFFEKHVYNAGTWYDSAFLGDWSDSKGNTWHFAYDKEEKHGVVGSLKEKNGAESTLVYFGKEFHAGEESGYRDGILIVMEDASGARFEIEGYLEELSKDRIVIDREEDQLILTREGGVEGLYQDLIEDRLIIY